MEKKTIFAALAALVGLVWLFRKGDSTQTTIPGFTTGPGPTAPATTAATGSNPILIVSTQTPRPVTADPVASNPIPPPAPVASQGFTVGGVTTGTTAAEWTPTPTNTVTADSQFSSQAEYNEYQRRVQGLGW